MVIEAGKATLHECQAVYSIGDVYLLLEIITVNSYNRECVEDYYRAKEKT